MVKSEKIVPLPFALLIIVVGGVTCVATAKWLIGSASTKNSIERSVDDTSSYSSRIVSGESDLFYAPTRNPPYKASEVSLYRTRESAIKALAVQFDRTPSWVEANIGSTNDLSQIHNNLNRALLTQTSGVVRLPTQYYRRSEGGNARTGRVDYGLVSTLRQAWSRDGLRSKPKLLQAQAMAVMVMVVNTDVKNPADRQATLDHIQANIGSW